MLIQAAKEFDIDITHSWMIGDILHDVEAGNKAGCRSILINNGNETEWVLDVNRQPEFITSGFLQAALYISEMVAKSG
jgi:histidinol phosphatase-like enzyme